MRALPTGTVTFLFTDIEGSTKLLQQLGAEAYSAALADHRRQIRHALARHGGIEVDTQGDSFLIAFGDADEALATAEEAQHALASGSLRVRMGVHTGTPHIGSDGYVGEDVHLGSRIADAAHGGQVLMSDHTRDVVTGAIELLDLGEHRLKGFNSPVWIYQLGMDVFPPLQTISNTNLPRPVSSFVGRDREVAEISDLVRDRSRLVTLTGAGGSGKTRLAIESAITLVPDFPNGVFWVDLAPLHDPSLVRETIALTLGARDDLAEHIGTRGMLLVLDNLEQVVESAPQLSSLLTACANLQILVTSRELMRVSGEVEYAVQPLATPDAVALFAARSGLEPTETIAALCSRLDNLPLAVELAAARTGVLSPSQILERLGQSLDLLKGSRDSDARQMTLRATIAWSHDLLSIEERLLFARLGVFIGGWTIEAAEEIVRADLDVLQSLVSKSLVRHTDERFTMLETIRQYATERLDESTETNDLRRRHAMYYLALAEEAEPSLLGPSPAQWLDRLELEFGNLRAALEYLEASGEGQLLLRLVGALGSLWTDRGPMVEGARRVHSALRVDSRPTAARAKALGAASELTRLMGDHASSWQMAEERLVICRRLGDSHGIADAAWSVGFALTEEGVDFERAVNLLEESIRIFRRLGDAHNTLGAVRTQAHTYQVMGDIERARTLIEENLGEARALGDTQVESVYLGQLATYSVWEGRLDDAKVKLRQSSRLALEFGEPIEVLIQLCRFADLLAIAGKAPAALRVLSSADALRDELGAAFEPWNAKLNAQTLTVVRLELDESEFEREWQAGRGLTPAAAVELALGQLEPSS